MPMGLSFRRSSESLKEPKEGNVLSASMSDSYPESWFEVSLKTNDRLRETRKERKKNNKNRKIRNKKRKGKDKLNNYTK